MEDRYAVLYLHSPRENLFGRVFSIGPSGVIFRGIPLDQIETFKYQFKNDEPSVFFQTGFYPLHRIERMIEDEAQGPLPSVLDSIVKTSQLSEEAIRQL